MERIMIYKIRSQWNKFNKKAFTLIELLVVVAIIGILAAVGVVAYNGYTSSAKKAVVKQNHKAVVKYITTEVLKCSMGESTAMDGELDCTKSGTSNWKNDVAQTTVKVLNRNFKNPYTSLPPVSHGGNITNDTDVGYNRLRSPGTKIQVITCVKTPCSGTQCSIPNHICSNDIDLSGL